MIPQPPRVSPSARPSPQSARLLFVAALIIFATWVAYLNSFAGALVYDDRTSIIENGSIRHLWPPGAAFLPPDESGTGGRPIANFTFAVSYALSGLKPWGHHLLNLTTHTLAALVLFGVVRRTLLQPALRGRFGAAALPLAGAIAGLWAVHPVQTQVVTYLSQRTESLMGLFYLLTVYGFIRGAEARPRLWFQLAVVACLVGVMCKEVIATAPLLVLLYDRTFVAGSFAAALRRRWELYAALAATWIPLAVLLVGVGERGVGYGLGVPWFTYALTECEAVLLYLKLGFWPHPLVFDRGLELVTDPLAAVPSAIFVAGLLGGTVWALRRRPLLGFIGAWFFVILAPTSSVIPVSQQPIAENRLYLPLAAVIVLAVLALYTLTGRRIALVICTALAVGGIAATARRNRDFASDVALWTDTLAKVPHNARAHYNLGVILLGTPAVAEAVDHLAEAVRLKADYVDARQNLATGLLMLGRVTEAIAEFEQLLARLPSSGESHSNLGLALLQVGRADEALAHGRVAVRLLPLSPNSHYNYASTLAATGHTEDAIREFEAALHLNPADGMVHFGLGQALVAVSRPAAAIAHFERSVSLLPDFVPAREALAAARAAVHP